MADMEPRVAVLETRLDGIAAELHDMRVESRADIARLAGMIERLTGRVEEINGKVERLTGKVEQLPTAWQMIAGLIGAGIAFAGIVIGAIRFAMH